MMAQIIVFLISFVDYFEKILSMCVLIRVILSWFPNARVNWFTRVIVDVTQPLFLVVYKLMPSLRNGGIDFSPIIVFIGLQLVRDIVIQFLAAML